LAHRPVLLTEVLRFLQPEDESLHVDATFGGGGYSRAILNAARCRVIGIDRDPEAVTRGAVLARSCAAFTMLHASFGRMQGRLAEVGVAQVDGIVFDLGVSSFQLEAPGRGFSFQSDGPLDMRMAQEGVTAADLVNGLDEQDLARLLEDYGDEARARAIARAIVAARRAAPLRTTRELAELVARVKGGGRGPRDPATQTFQALRIAVNDELGELARGLAAAQALLRPGGRLVVVSFHSGEDRLVKRFVNSAGGRQVQASRHLPPMPPPPAAWRWISRRAVQPGPDELAANPRARSARLRAAVRLRDPVPSAGDEEEVRWSRAA
jgi:16S rRNA (cytosine1402-N4)-methyltransferase